MMISRCLQATLAAALLVALGACSTENDASPSGAQPAVTQPPTSDEQVTIQDSAFSVEELTVPLGTTVTWVNEDDFGHTITNGEEGVAAPDALFDEPLNAGQTVSYTFDEPGTYPVTCTIHTEMQMTVTVEGG